MDDDSSISPILSLKGRIAASGGGLSAFKEEIEELYKRVTNKTLRFCNCPDKYKDALIEIEIYYKRMERNVTATLRGGIVLQYKGETYTNANITDEVAREFLSDFPGRTDWFIKLPAEPKAEEPETVEKPKTKSKSKAKAKSE